MSELLVKAVCYLVLLSIALVREVNLYYVTDRWMYLLDILAKLADVKEKHIAMQLAIQDILELVFLNLTLCCFIVQPSDCVFDVFQVLAAFCLAQLKYAFKVVDDEHQLRHILHFAEVNVLDV